MNLTEILNDHKKGKRADLRWAKLSGAKLSEADLHKAKLRGANLRGADLRGANLRGADLRWADLSEADLREADLRGADLRWADLSEAKLSGAKLSGVKGVLCILFDDRGYVLICWQRENILYFNAGCRSYNKKEAVAHWSSKDYPDKKRGEMYVKSIYFLVDMWQFRNNEEN